jgi:hypothetical protein
MTNTHTDTDRDTLASGLSDHEIAELDAWLAERDADEDMPSIPWPGTVNAGEPPF